MWVGRKRDQPTAFDSMFADMDLSLREMGAGDIGVSKRVRVMAEAFLGRLDAYVTALDKMTGCWGGFAPQFIS